MSNGRSKKHSDNSENQLSVKIHHKNKEKHERGCRGHTGKTGATGATGSLTSSFISYYSNESQNIPFSAFAYLAFTTLQTTNGTITASASGIAPGGTVDTFTILIPGIYLISWNTSITSGNNIVANLDLLINGTAINSPFEQQAYGGGSGGAITGVVSGSFLIDLNPGQTIQFKASVNLGEITAYLPSISILRVADIP